MLIRIHEKSFYYVGWLLVSVMMMCVSGCIYLYLNQCPTDKILSDVDNIVQSLDTIHESLDNIAQAIGIDNVTRKVYLPTMNISFINFLLLTHYQYSVKDVEIISSSAYKAKSVKDDELSKGQMPVHNPFVDEKPRKSYKVGRVQESSDPSFISWFAVFKRLFYH